MGFHQTKKNLFAFAKQVVTLFSRIYKALCKLVKSALGQSLLHGRFNVPVKFPILKPAKDARPESNAASLPQPGVKTELDNDVSATLKPTTSKLHGWHSPDWPEKLSSQR
jgi:hypothetical protein